MQNLYYFFIKINIERRLNHQPSTNNTGSPHNGQRNLFNDCHSGI